MRRLLAVFTVAAMALTVTGVAQAGYFVAAESLMAVSLGSINNYGIPAAGGGSVSLVDNGLGGHDVQIDASVWATVNFGFGTSLYTGVPLMDNFLLTVANAQLTATSNFTAVNMLNVAQSVVGPGLGGIAPMLDGKLALVLFGARVVTFPLDLVGAPAGGTFHTSVVGIPFDITYMPWVTEPVAVTGVTTNVVSWNGQTGAGIALRLTPEQHGKVRSTGFGFVTTNAGLPLELHTVTLSGPNALLSASATGSITIVSPIRINTSAAVAGRVPGAAWLDFVFVPEPGTMLLLVAGAAGLIVIGRRRARK
jgi:hypothetical protein